MHNASIAFLNYMHKNVYIYALLQAVCEPADTSCGPKFVRAVTG